MKSALIDPASPAVNQNRANLVLHGGTRMADGVRDEMEKAAIDETLREMMRAANELPVPDHLLKFVEALDGQPVAEDESRKAAG